MQNTKVFKMVFARVYSLYLAKVEKKGRTRQELDTVSNGSPATTIAHFSASLPATPTSKYSLPRLRNSIPTLPKSLA